MDFLEGPVLDKSKSSPFFIHQTASNRCEGGKSRRRMMPEWATDEILKGEKENEKANRDGAVGGVIDWGYGFR
jgi:hypothetical protein